MSSLRCWCCCCLMVSSFFTGRKQSARWPTSSGRTTRLPHAPGTNFHYSGGPDQQQPHARQGARRTASANGGPEPYTGTLRWRRARGHAEPNIDSCGASPQAHHPELLHEESTFWAVSAGMHLDWIEATLLPKQRCLLHLPHFGADSTSVKLLDPKGKPHRVTQASRSYKKERRTQSHL